MHTIRWRCISTERTFGSEVWVNGNHVGSIQGAFIRGRFEITKLVKAGETAVLAVQVYPQPHPDVGGWRNSER